MNARCTSTSPSPRKPSHHLLEMCETQGGKLSSFLCKVGKPRDHPGQLQERPRGRRRVNSGWARYIIRNKTFRQLNIELDLQLMKVEDISFYLCTQKYLKEATATNVQKLNWLPKVTNFFCTILRPLTHSCRKRENHKPDPHIPVTCHFFPHLKG